MLHLLARLGEKINRFRYLQENVATFGDLLLKSRVIL